MNFGNVITEIPVTRSAPKKKTNCDNTVAKIGEEKKKLWQLWQCIAEIGEEKK